MERAEEILDRPFVALAAASCPAYDEMLVSLEREFRAVDRNAVADALDDAARSLFALAGAAPDERVVALARAAWALLPDEGREPTSWLFSRALQDGRASGAVRAAAAVELGRRAGIPARPIRLHGCWAVHLSGGDAQMAADVGQEGPDEPPYAPIGALCAHQLAFSVLTGLAEAWRQGGDAPRAQRACGLRLLLPLEDDLRRVVHSEMRALGGAA